MLLLPPPPPLLLLPPPHPHTQAAYNALVANATAGDAVYQSKMNTVLALLNATLAAQVSHV